MSKKIEALIAKREALEKAISEAKEAEAKRKRESVIRMAERTGIFALDEQFLQREFERIARDAKSKSDTTDSVEA